MNSVEEIKYTESSYQNKKRTNDSAFNNINLNNDNYEIGGQKTFKSA